MENRNFYNEILTEHNIHPDFKHEIDNPDITLDGVNPSCGDKIKLELKLDGDTISDGAFTGDGCAISQASADIMLGMIIGKHKDEALKLADTFMKMIRGEATEEEIDSLEEASALKDIAHMPQESNAPCSGGELFPKLSNNRQLGRRKTSLEKRFSSPAPLFSRNFYTYKKQPLKQCQRLLFYFISSIWRSAFE